MSKHPDHTLMSDACSICSKPTGYLIGPPAHPNTERRCVEHLPAWWGVRPGERSAAA